MALLPEAIHVLLVDDEQLSRFVVGNLLRKCNYAVTVVDSGRGALDILCRSTPGTFQLILTDLMMPEVDGLDILRYVRGNGALADLPVIMMSANEQQDTVFEAIKGGAEEYLVKPVTRKEVQNIWQHVWKRVSAQQQLVAQQQLQAAPAKPQPQSQQQHAPAAAAAVLNRPGAGRGLQHLQQQQKMLQQQSQQHQQQRQQMQQQELLRAMQEHHAGQAVQQQHQPEVAALAAGGSSASCNQQQQQQQPQQPQDFQSLAFFLGTLHGHRSAQVSEMRLSVEDLDGQIAAVQAALQHVEPQQQQEQQAPPAAAAAADAPAANGGAEMQLSASAIDGGGADDSDDDEMERRERGRGHKRQRLMAPNGVPQQQQQQQQQQQGLVLLRSASSCGNSGALPPLAQAAAAAGVEGGVTTAADAASMLPQWQHISGRFDVLETVYLRHKQTWEQQQPQQQPQLCNGAGSDAVQQPAATPAAAAPATAAAAAAAAAGTPAVGPGRAAALPRYLQDFGEDLWSYGRYTRLAVRGTVRAAADVLGGGSAMVCAVAFDRDDEYVATAGVSKRVRIYEYAGITSGVAAGSGGGGTTAAARRSAPAGGGGGCSSPLSCGGSDGGSADGYGGLLGIRAAADGGGGSAAAAAATAGSIVYPVLELASRARLSCVAWSPYVKAQLASSDYEGVVQLWDANTGSELMQFEEHSKRAWAVDFSRLEPTRLVSSSDDGTVKLWSIHQEASAATLQLRANVCSVAFSPESPHLLAAGCAHCRFYLFDLRAPASPLVVVPGHRRSVSYVRWLDGQQLVTASTDNTLRLWSVPELLAAGSGAAAAGSSRELSGSAAAAACRMTYRGHTNQRNFIGLAVLPGSPGALPAMGPGRGGGAAAGGGGSGAGSSGSGGGYIACGSETNEVFAYHSAVPAPLASHRFAPLSLPWGYHSRLAQQGGDLGGLADLTEGAGGRSDAFVSAVAWNQRRGSLVAANSAGHIQVLELV